MNRKWALITKLKIAVQDGRLPLVFTLEDVKRWFREENPKKADGSPYRQDLATLLSHAVVRETSNRDSKFLRCKIGDDGVKRFWLDLDLTF